MVSITRSRIPLLDLLRLPPDNVHYGAMSRYKRYLGYVEESHTSVSTLCTVRLSSANRYEWVHVRYIQHDYRHWNGKTYLELRSLLCSPLVALDQYINEYLHQMHADLNAYQPASLDNTYLVHTYICISSLQFDCKHLLEVAGIRNYMHVDIR